MLAFAHDLQRRKNRWVRGLVVTLALAFLATRLYGAAHFYSHSAQLDTQSAAGKHTTLQSACEICVAAAKLDKSWFPPLTQVFLRAPRFQSLIARVARIIDISVPQHYPIRAPPFFDR